MYLKNPFEEPTATFMMRWKGWSKGVLYAPVDDQMLMGLETYQFLSKEKGRARRKLTKYLQQTYSRHPTRPNCAGTCPRHTPYPTLSAQSCSSRRRSKYKASSQSIQDHRYEILARGHSDAERILLLFGRFDRGFARRPNAVLKSRCRGRPSSVSGRFLGFGRCRSLHCEARHRRFPSRDTSFEVWSA